MNVRVATVETQCVNGAWRVQLPLPLDVDGECQVRAFVQGAGAFAMGEAAVKITAPAAAK